MMDFVHLDDMFVIFLPGTDHMRSVKIPQINIITGNVPDHRVFKSTGSGVQSSK